jgi:aldose 1-epimerase
VTIAADRFTPVDKGLIPTGEMRSVKGTPFDFREPHAIGERIDANDEQLKFGAGYDLNFVLNSGGGAPALAARVSEPSSGRVMEVLTTQPGLQFYTGNHLDKPGSGFCMETQHFPDSPNHPTFPTTTLKAGEHYRQSTEFRFSTQK